MKTSTIPTLTTYDQDHLARIALPLGGIGTGTVSLGGRGNLRDWELMNRPAKGFIPSSGRGSDAPFFALYARPAGGSSVSRVLEGPLERFEYEGQNGSRAPHHGLPRFQNCTFSAAYPFGQVHLSDPGVPLTVRLEAFNPLIPCEADKSGIPVAVLRYVFTNRTRKTVTASICGSLRNFIGNDGTDQNARANRNRFRKGKAVQGIFMDTRGVDPKSPQWGTLALTTPSKTGITSRTAWVSSRWGTSVLDFWDDFSENGRLENRRNRGEDTPMASLTVRFRLPPRASKAITFFLTWHFPNRIAWTPRNANTCCGDENRIGNYYTTQYRNAWDVAEKTVPQIRALETETRRFVETFCASDLPHVVKEAALSNLSTLRSQTCFRTPDGRLYGFEGCNDNTGCCIGSCTHVWNYEQSVAFLFGDLARTMRDVEFNHTLDKTGLMSFRVNLPLQYARTFGKAAADGQMGCLMKLYRDWQLSGDDAFLQDLYPKAKQALAFCWVKGGWDADQDGVMEGCQHNTMDVEYYGPNPQMGFWYLGALRATEEMARHVGDSDFAATCQALYKRGSQWLDTHLFNGEFYEHEIRPPKKASDVSKSLRAGMGAANLKDPDFQLGPGCLVDQLIGQLFAHICDLGYLAKPAHIRKTLKSIYQYNRKTSLEDHFNCMRSYALGDEAALLMASYPKNRPKNPFPYFTEVMTGFEYTAAIGMLYESQTQNGLRCIKDIRDRYDGQKRSPFDEAECGHHYARAMIAWAAPLALTGFHYSAVQQTMAFASQDGTFFWSTGYAWGTCQIKPLTKTARVTLTVLGGTLSLSRFTLSGYGTHTFTQMVNIRSNRPKVLTIAPKQINEHILL